MAFSIVIISFAFTVSPAGVGSQKDRRKVPQPLKITVTPWGPTQADIDAAKLRTENSETVQSILNNTNDRLMSLEYIGSQNNKKPPTRFRIIYYDYTNNRTYTAEGDFAGTEKIKSCRPISSPESPTKSWRTLTSLRPLTGTLALLAESKKIEFSAAMPPVTMVEGERYVNVGVRNNITGEFRVVGVGFKNNTVLKYEGGAPKASRSAEDTCGLPNAFQQTTDNGTPGQAS